MRGKIRPGLLPKLARVFLVSTVAIRPENFIEVGQQLVEIFRQPGRKNQL